MAKKFNVQILTPETKAFDEEIEEMVLQTSSGEIGILADHENLISDLKVGEAKIVRDGKSEILALGDGFIKIEKGAVTILTDLAALDETIIEAEVEAARKSAEEALKEKTMSDEEYAITAANLQKALAQLKVKRRHRV